MLPKRDNYALQAEFARQLFLGYDQTDIISRTNPAYDRDWLYLSMLNRPYRISRREGHIFRQKDGQWVSADSHGEVLTIFDYLCDSKPGRSLSGRWMTTAALGGHVHTGLFSGPGPLETAIDRNPEAFRAACIALGGTPVEGGDLSFRLPFFPDLPVLVRFWHSDDEFPPALDCLWDANALQFLRYETLYYALGLLRRVLSGAVGL